VTEGTIEKIPAFEELEAIMDRTDREKPSKEDVAELRRMLEKYPDLWRVGGDMAQQAIWHRIESLKATPFIKKSITRGIEAIRHNLGYDDALEVERLLIEQVALCWLRLNLLEYEYTTIRNERTMNIDQADFLEKRLNYAQRRFLRACETLARVRKVIRRTPALQVNIGGQQVNVLGDVKREG
jgi:hypothetical protein